MPKSESTVGLAWYRADQWAQLLEVAIDRDRLEDTHEEWESGAKRTLRELLISGVDAIKVDVDVDDLIGWCDKKGLPVDGSSRAFYVADRVRLSNI